MEDFKKENNELKIKVAFLEKLKEKYKNEVIHMSCSIAEAKAIVEEKLIKERKTAFDYYCRKKKLDLENKCKDLDEKNTKLQSEMEDLTSTRSELETVTSDLRNTNTELEKRISSLTSLNIEKDEDIQRLSGREMELDKRNKQLEDNLARSLENCEGLQERTKELEQTIKGESEKNTDEAQKAAKKMSDLENMLQISNQQNTRMTKGIDSLQQENDTLKETLKTERAKHSDHAQIAAKKMSEMDDVLKISNQHNTQMIKEIDNLNQDSNTLKKTIRNERQKNTEEVEKAAKKMSDLEDMLQISNQQNTRMCKEIDTLQQEHDVLKETMKTERAKHSDEAQTAAKKMSEMEDVLKISNQHNTRMTKEIDSLNQDNNALKETIKDERQRKADESQKAAKICLDLENVLEISNQQNTRMAKEIDTLHQENDFLKDTIKKEGQKYSDEAQTAAKKMSDLEDRLQVSNQHIKHMTEDRDRLHQDHNDFLKETIRKERQRNSDEAQRAAKKISDLEDVLQLTNEQSTRMTKEIDSHHENNSLKDVTQSCTIKTQRQMNSDETHKGNMTDLRKENGELKKKISILERFKEKYKKEVIEMSGKIEEEKAKAGEKLMKERRNAFENYCIKKKIDLEKKYKDVDERNKLLQSEVKDLAEARRELERMTLDLTNRNNELENRITSLASRNSKQEEDIKILSKEKRQVEQSNQQLEDILAGSLKQCEDLKNKAKELEQTVENERQRNRDKAQKADKSISDLEGVLRISNQHNSRMTQEINSLHQEHDALKETTLKTTQELKYHKSSSDSKHRDLIPLPSDWESMPENVNCKMYSATEDAFSMVSRRFMETINSSQVKIIKVDRIQNKCLYKQYHLKKHQISLHSRSSNEKLLWHGTHGEAVYGITVNGFDRGYKGHNVGTIYGQGVYFSASSRYSVDYSRPDINKECHMFFARVLTGDSTLGKPEYKVPPIKDHSSYTRYDSLVNRTDNPGIYVVMNDTQAYPEYLVTYQVLSG